MAKLLKKKGMAKMKYVKIEKSENGYNISEENSDSLYRLADFLLEEIMDKHAFNFFTNWLEGKSPPEADSIGGNSDLGLEQQKNGLIYIYDLLEPNEEPSQGFSTSKSNMLKIFGDWVATVRHRPKTIIISQEGEDIKFTSEN